MKAYRKHFGIFRNKVVTAEIRMLDPDATVKIVKGGLPFFVKPFVLPAMSCFLDDRMLHALGYPPPSTWLKFLVQFAMRCRAIFLRNITFKKYPDLVTDEKNRTYPNGYDIEQLGPEKVLKNL